MHLTRTAWPAAAILLTLILTGNASGQVPHVINYQGQVSVNGVPFDGQGWFKFALVDETGGTTYWSNDGTSSGGDEPAAAVPITVTRGVFSVLLGDTSVEKMGEIHASVFENILVYLRVWFDDGIDGFQQLSPDQRVSSVGYALMAETVPAASITNVHIAPGAVRSTHLAAGAVGTSQLATGAVGTAQLAAGAVGATQLAPGAAAANLSASGQSGVVSGSVILSPEDNPALEAAGFVKIGQAEIVPESWTPRGSIPSTGFLDQARTGHSAVWTGSEMLVWGGDNGSYLGDGLRYNPATDSWTFLSEVGAPSPRAYHAAVWTGSRMLVCGGTGGGAGGIYDPVADAWTAMSTSGAPSVRYGTAAVWAGNRMVVWGGTNGGDRSGGGSRYNPTTNAWSPISATGAPSERAYMAFVSTGTEMVVWGGSEYGSEYGFAAANDGARYNPVTDQWVPINIAGRPQGRWGAKAVWTGSEMILWGGQDGDYHYLSDGGRYNPSTDTWVPVTSTDAPSARARFTAVWTGSRMVVWGGNQGYTTSLNTGGQYNAVTGAWTATATAGAPSGREYHTAVWTGSQMLVWGGETDLYTYTGTGGRYTPGTNTWTPMASTPPSGEPGAREYPALVWTGSEVIAWGGQNSNHYLHTGARYTPATDAWTSISSLGAPSGRFGHTALWTGNEMIVWGGYDGGYPNAGSRYDPVADAWTPTSDLGAPAGRLYHSAVWTGSEMIVWGGANVGTGGGGALRYLNDGARYDPVADAWTPVGSTGAPGARGRHTAVWAGSEMIVWGGFYSPTGGLPPFTFYDNGARYRPADDTWTALPGGAPQGRHNHTAVWTGSRMLVWGGGGNGVRFNTGGRYDPGGNTWALMSTAGAPSARTDHTAVWDGARMVVWGGYDGSNPVSTGGLYDPVSDRWTATVQPEAGNWRYRHAAVWTGAEMFVCGGQGTTDYLDTCIGYAPPRKTYLYLKP